MKRSISKAIVLSALCSLVSIPAQAYPPLARERAARETHGTKCIWSNDEQYHLESKVKLISYFPVVDGDVAALVVHTGDGGTVLREFSFQFNYVENFVFPNVTPGVNVEYDDNGTQHQILHLALSDLQSNGVVKGRNAYSYNLVQKFGHPVNVRFVVIGGHQVTSPSPGKLGVGAMDIIVAHFVAEQPNGENLVREYNYDAREVNSGSDPLLQGIKCVIHH